MLHIGPNYHNVIIWYYNDILITLTKIQAFCILRTPFDIVVNALFNHGCHPIQSSPKICFYKYAHNSIPRGAPDMSLSAFDVKFHDKNEGMPPGACRPPKSEKHKNNVQNMGLKQWTKNKKYNPKWAPQNPRPSARARGPGDAAPWQNPCV